MSSVLNTFAPPLNQVKKGRTDEEAVYLGSVKANIGHGGAASGVSSVIKVLIKTLAALGPVSEEIVRKYIHIWKEIKFLN